jgi:hypothetical protein
MRRYSVYKSSKNYIVSVDGNDVLICKSRREAEKMVSDAIDLMNRATSSNEHRADDPDSNQSGSGDRG